VGSYLVGFHGLSTLFFFLLTWFPFVAVLLLVWLPRLMSSLYFGYHDSCPSIGLVAAGYYPFSLVTTVDVYLAETGDVLYCESAK